MKKIIWITFAAMALLMGLYPGIYLLLDNGGGFLDTKPLSLQKDSFWKVEFFLHIFSGAISMLTGWIQFNEVFRHRYPALHKRFGKIYLVSVLLSSTSSIYIGWFANGGIVSSLGFICLGLIWFFTTISGFISISKGEVRKHRTMMAYSYSACYSAVTLRLLLPVLLMMFEDYILSYNCVAWLCWIPNLIVAFFINRKMNNSFQNRNNNRYMRYRIKENNLTAS